MCWNYTAASWGAKEQCIDNLKPRAGDAAMATP